MDDRLTRSVDDRVLAGVAGGVAQHWDADPSLVRILWVLAAIFTGGLALVVYIVMAIVVPEGTPVMVAGRSGPAGPADPMATGGRPPTRAEVRAARRAARRARRAGRDDRGLALIGGGFLILIGGWFLLREFIPAIDAGWFWPLLIIGLGVVLILSAASRHPEGPPSGDPR